MITEKKSGHNSKEQLFFVKFDIMGRWGSGSRSQGASKISKKKKQSIQQHITVIIMHSKEQKNPKLFPEL